VMKFLERLFGRREKTAEDITEQPTTPSLKPVMVEEVTKPLAPHPDLRLLDEEGKDDFIKLPQLIAGCSQSVGQQRDHNEDALFTLTTTFASNESNLPFGFYIVADGMGGHQHGEIASATAIRAMVEYVIRNLYTPIFSVAPQPPEEPLQEILQNGVQVAHNAILKTVSGGGTTLTAVLILGNQMTIAHVGDSRVYTVDTHGKMFPLTRDHSLVKRLEELGQLTPEEAAVHPQRNVLYRALGQGEPIEPEIISAPFPKSGYLLICSDGLWGVVEENEISDIIISATTPHEACQELVKAANLAGGPDNITAVLVQLPED
jgi:serine/threonine protein phosphatase PrpC